MPDALSITASSVDPGCCRCRGRHPSRSGRAAGSFLPKGLSRHLVRFANLSGRVVAIKETTEEMARREYDMLGNLDRLDAPCVDPVAVIAGADGCRGPPVPAALVTAHLKFSLPYRALFTDDRCAPTPPIGSSTRLSVLLVRLHNVGFPGATCRCRTRSSAATPVRSPPTWWMPRPASCTRAAVRRAARARSRRRASEHRGRAHGPAGGRTGSTAASTRSRSRRASVVRYEHLWAALTEPETLSAEESLALQRAGAPAQRPRLRRRRDADRWPRPDGRGSCEPRRSSTPVTTGAGCCA